MRRGKVLTSTELLCVCGCLKQNQLQNCHTPSASLESSRDFQTFMDREAIKIDNKDSSSNIKQESGITLATFALHSVVDFKAPESWQRVQVVVYLFCFVFWPRLMCVLWELEGVKIEFGCSECEIQYLKTRNLAVHLTAYLFHWVKSLGKKSCSL